MARKKRARETSPRAKRISGLTMFIQFARSGFPKRKGKAKAFVVKRKLF